MTAPTPEDPSARTPLQQHLHTIAGLLRHERPLRPEAQRLLAGLMDEIGSALEAQTVSPAELNQLAEHVAQLVQAAHAGEEVGFIGQLRERLDEAAAELESRAPRLTGLTRRLIETLSDLGI